MAIGRENAAWRTTLFEPRVLTYSSCVASQAESTELQITDVTVIVGHENLWKALLFFDHEIVQKHQGIFLFFISRPFIYLQRVSYHRSRFVLICHM